MGSILRIVVWAGKEVTMDEIRDEVDMLLDALLNTRVYREYRHQEDLLSEDPKLKERVLRFRADNFNLQNNAQGQDLFSVVGNLYQESRELRKNDQVNAYLDAELAMCKLLQKLARTIVEGLEIEVPDIG